MQLFQVILYNIALHEELGERNEMNELIEVAGRPLFAPVAFAANPISRIAASKHLLPVWVFLSHRLLLLSDSLAVLRNQLRAGEESNRTIEK